MPDNPLLQQETENKALEELARFLILVATALAEKEHAALKGGDNNAKTKS